MAAMTPALSPLSVPLQQSPQFARALAALGVDVLSDAPVVTRRRFGPLGAVTFASRLRAADLAARPRVINAEDAAPDRYRAAGYRQIITPAHCADWDLDVPDLTVGMSGAWRTALRSGKAQGLRVKLSRWAGTPHVLFDHARALERIRGFRGYPLSLLAAFAKVDPANALLFEAFDRGHLVAACLVLRHGATATYQTAWSSAEGRRAEAARVLLIHAARHLKSLGTTTFDLGLVDTDHGKGLARFKLGSGARPRTLGGTWLRVI